MAGFAGLLDRINAQKTPDVYHEELPMRSPARVVVALLLLQVGGFQARAGAQGTASVVSPTPVIVAVDTSRSLDRGGLGTAMDRLRLALAGLDGETPTGLLAFDDSPRWVTGPGARPAEVGRALAELELQGRFTLLNDAIFVATRALEEGGVVLLLSDGKDENSATTVDDIARRCEALGIRILTLGTGRGIQERPLRRLALISGGEFLGAAESLDGAEIARSVVAAQDEIEAAGRPGPEANTATRTGAVDGLPASPAATSSTPGKPPVEDGGGSGREEPGGNSRLSVLERWAPWLLAGLALVALVAWRAWGRSRAPVSTFCARCGSELAAGESDCEQCAALELEQQLAGREIASLQEAPEVTVDTAVFLRNSFEESLEKTRVMNDQGVLVVRRGGESPRLYLLGNDKAFAVGRQAEGNTLAIPDPALSAQHFKVVPEEGCYYFVDLQSTNGSFVNGHRSSAKRLHTGDVIRAGQVEFEYQNPSEV